ncbi:flagellar hook capping FlgD N-terminal domain-containing protein [Nocardioides sp. CER19]|uniref:flagellar hook assembly protein FlgD n=1 Tax=Nocardioides sp. CER19 TaxID=3038538 RepID=UPI002449BB41|nr:flagellar hook capping FlgD N-terminal domain-containing protein [Nocardioides sp. CER19]MDH2414624.1 flagellar hook capping FlgD N-terminal domain-containing protein [Nocardioides sp. CER19]
MSVSSTEGVSSGLLALANSSSSGSSKATDDQDMFLQLLVAQLKYQDPMNPTDSTEFLSQNAQFTALSKMQDVADGISQLTSLQLSFGAAGMIGRQVTYTDATGASKTGIATGAGFPSTGPVLTVDGTEVPLTSVTSVTAPSTSA